MYIHMYLYIYMYIYIYIYKREGIKPQQLLLAAGSRADPP